MPRGRSRKVSRGNADADEGARGEHRHLSRRATEGVARVDADGDLMEEILARSRDRAQRFERWIEQLRAGDPVFAEASVLYPAI